MIQLELQPEVEAQLTVEAASRGLALDRYIEEIVAARAGDPDDQDSLRVLDEEQLARDLEQGLREISLGKSVAAHQVFSEFREKHGLRG